MTEGGGGEQQRLKAVTSASTPDNPKFRFIDESRTFHAPGGWASNRRIVRGHVMRHIREQHLDASRRRRKASPPNPSVNSSAGVASQTDRRRQSGHVKKFISYEAPAAAAVRTPGGESPRCVERGERLDILPVSETKEDDIRIGGPDFDCCLRDILTRSHPRPVSQPWADLASGFWCAGVGVALGEEFQTTFGTLFHSFITLNSSFWPLEPVDAQAIVVAAVMTEKNFAILHTFCLVGAIHAIASTARASYPVSMGSSNQELAQVALLHKSRALTLANHLVTAPQDSLHSSAALITVFSLAILAAITGDLDSAAIHARGMKMMIQARGGIDTLDNATLNNLYSGDVLIASSSFGRPCLPLSRFWRNRVQYLSSSDFAPCPEGCGQVGSRFFGSDLGRGLHSTMLRNLRVVRHLVLFLESVRQREPSRQSPTPFYTNGDFAVAQHLLLSFPFETDGSRSRGDQLKEGEGARQETHAETEDKTSNEAQECCRIATLIYCQKAIFCAPAWFGSTRTLVRHLRSAIIRLDYAHYRRVQPDFLLWILGMGCIAADGLKERLWFLLSIVDIVSHMGLRNAEETSRILQRYFFSAAVLDWPLKRIWEEVSLVTDDM